MTGYNGERAFATADSAEELAIACYDRAFARVYGDLNDSQLRPIDIRDGAIRDYLTSVRAAVLALCESVDALMEGIR